LRAESGVTYLTDRAIGEYRRFLYLTQIAAHDLTPSKAIDSIWHLHLLYTQSYRAGPRV
jgi:hypothetical protein